MWSHQTKLLSQAQILQLASSKAAMGSKIHRNSLSTFSSWNKRISRRSANSSSGTCSCSCCCICKIKPTILPHSDFGQRPNSKVGQQPWCHLYGRKRMSQNRDKTWIYAAVEARLISTWSTGMESRYDQEKDRRAYTFFFLSSRYFWATVRFTIRTRAGDSVAKLRQLTVKVKYKAHWARIRANAGIKLFLL